MLLNIQLTDNSEYIKEQACLIIDTDNVAIVAYLPMGLSMKEANDICEAVREMFIKLCHPQAFTIHAVTSNKE